MAQFEIHEFSMDSMRRIAAQIRRLEALYQNINIQLQRLRYEDTKVPRAFLCQATETITGRLGTTAGAGEAKVKRLVIDQIEDYEPDGVNNLLREINNHVTTAISANNEFLAVEDAFGKLWPVVTEPTPEPGTGTSSGEIRHGYATLNGALCATGTASVTNLRLIDGTLVNAGPVTISNVYLHRGRSGDRVYVSLINFDGAGDAWTIVDVTKQQQIMQVDLFYEDLDTGTGSQDMGGCAIKTRQVAVAAEECGPASEAIKISLYDLDVVTNYEVQAATEQEPCKIIAHTKRICQFEQTPVDGNDVTVASLTKKTFLRRIYEEQMCVSGTVVPIIAGDIFEAYVLCAGNTQIEEQIAMQVCPGAEQTCTGTGTV